MPTIELRDYTERALKRISPVYDGSRFIRDFFNGVGISYDLLREYFTTFSDQSFIDGVSWAIALQELKYSLDIREDLSLKKRRARLGIKARTHRPLNPARLEKYIKDKFGLDTYLYEKEAGYIRIYTEYLTKSGYKKMIDWLQVEKPAHLSLSTWINITEYTGGEGYGGDTIFNPDVPIKIPKNEADKKNFPRIFAGVAQFVTGTNKIGLKEPEKESEGEIFAGVAQYHSGTVTIAQKHPENTQIILRAGATIYVGGRVWIDSREKPTLPYYPFRLEPPYEPNENYNFYYDMIDKASIYLQEDEQVENNLRAVLKSALLKANSNADENIFGDVTFIPDDKLPKDFVWRNIEENPYSDLARASFAVSRGNFFFEEPLITDDSEWDIVKIFFGFPTSRHRRYRGIALPNPRGDLTKEEIKEAGQYGVDNKLIKNARGEFADKVLGAAYKRREVTKIDLGG